MQYIYILKNRVLYPIKGIIIQTDNIMEEFEIPPPDVNPFEPINVFTYKEEVNDNLSKILKQVIINILT